MTLSDRPFHLALRAALPAAILLIAAPFLAFAGPVSGPVSGEWRRADSPIVVTGDCYVTPDAPLLIDPGVQVLLMPGVSFVVGGALNAGGTNVQPVRFDAAVPGSPWRCVQVTDFGTAILNGCSFRNGGAAGPDENSGALRVDSAIGFLSMVNCEVSGSASSGVYLNGGSFSAAGCRFSMNGGAQPSDAAIHVVSGTVQLSSIPYANSITGPNFGVYNESIAPITTAGTWWGDPSGPQHSENEGGLGTSISDDVEFDGFATQPPAPLPGDANGDGWLDMSDVTLAMQVAGGLSATPLPTVSALDASPVVAPGAVGLDDAVRVLRLVTGRDAF